MICTIGGEKGGTGKTTICTNLAPLLEDVIVVDTDSIGIFSAWAAARNRSIREGRLKAEPIACIQKFGEVSEDVRDLATRYKNVLIDTPGRDSIELRDALTIADIVIYPLQVTQFDLWTLIDIQAITRRARVYNKGLRDYVLLNQCPTNTSEEQAEATSLINQVEDLTLINQVIYSRKAYRKAPSYGASVLEYKPIDFKARAEVINLFKEIGI